MAVTINSLGLKCSREQCEVIHRTPGGVVTKGLLGVLEDTIGFWLDAGTTAAEEAFCTKAPWAYLTCVAAPTAGYLQGDIAYYAAGTNSITGTAGGNTACGRFRKAVAFGAVVADVNFVGGTVG